MTRGRGRASAAALAGMTACLLVGCEQPGSQGAQSAASASALPTSGPAGSVRFLSQPIRIYDTRDGAGKIQPGQTRNLQVTGVAVGGLAIPKGAVGIVGSVTAVGPEGSGDLRLFPPGQALPLATAVSYSSGQFAVTSGVTVGLDANGQLAIYCDHQPTHVLVDAAGWIQ